MCLSQFLRNLFFIDAFKFVFYGLFNELKITDTPKLNKAYDTEKLFNRANLIFESILLKEKTKDEDKKLSPRNIIILLIWKMHKVDIVLGIIFASFHALMSTVARPLMLREIIIIVRTTDTIDDEKRIKGIILAVLISSTVLIEGFLGAHFRNQLSTKVGAQYLSWGMAMVHKKSTTVSTTSLKQSGIVISSLVGSDFIRIFEDFRRMCQLPSVIVALFGGIIVLFMTLKVASLVGLSVMFVVLVTNFKIIHKIKKIEEIDFKKGDKRISILSELLQGIKAIKLTAWEYPFQSLLNNIRQEETHYIRKYRLFQVTSMNLGRVSPALASCLSILTLVALNENDATPENLFVAMVTFLSLRLPLIGIPLFSSFLVNTLVGFQRIGDFLLLPDQPKQSLIRNETFTLQILNAKFTYNTKINQNYNDFIVKVDDLQIKKKQIVAIVGRVGSGKSSLLKSILGETIKLNGKLNITNKVAFVPQESFVLSGTIKENITLGKEFNEIWFKKCVKLSEFEEDLNQMSTNLKENLEVGERGQTLSGGQKQRLAICRAIYSNPDLLILDDPLSAVDSIVAQKIFFNIKNYFIENNKSVLMSLNQFHFLSHFDLISVMDKGEIVQIGNFTELCTNEGHLKNMLTAVDIDLLDISDTETDTSSNNSEIINSKNDDFEKLIQNEKMKNDEKNLFEKDYASKGAVTFDTFKQYITAMGPFTIPLTILLGTLTYGIFAFNDKRIFTQIASQQERQEMLRLSYIYLVLSIAHVFFIQSLSYHHCFSAIRAGRNLHKKAIDSLLHTPINWFESNPSGRILARFSGDLSLVDRTLQFIYDDLLQFIFMLSALSIVVSIILPYVIPVLLIGAFMFLLASNVLDKSNREVKRFANQNLSPVLTNISETESAKLVIQSMKIHDFFIKRQIIFIDNFVKQLHFSNYLSNWMLLVSGFVSFLLSLTVAILVIFLSHQINASEAGLALTYSFLIPYFLQFVSFQIILGLSSLTSLERILEYLKLPKEPNWHLDSDNLLKEKQWPTTGLVEFKNVSLIYRKGLKPALNNINFITKINEKIGIVGRTGAGKSSLTLLLFRVQECTKGQIIIDGIDIKQVGLQTLRSNLSSIPQHPLLLRGSVRKNLDPFDEFTEERVLKVMKRINIDLSLSSKPATDLSIGQRQLISLGRILLRKMPKIIVMDEPTANIDQETDQAIQKVLREEFKSSTLLMIAHRLDTVIDSDRILVLDSGEVKEFDKPSILLEKENGVFRNMVKSLGEITFEKLKIKSNKDNDININ